jgi:lipopolysaccharide transport system ATP-binding protein
VLGVIGRNGAGKSTLLKILSRITEPTTGYADIYGRVGSLLEVGTGFHPELTGRENIFLNGQILGMSRADIRRKFDEIVEFAELERFLDTPVKRYSSGMYTRLAFSVAAHLEPEVLVVDEVLAVGDAEFQKKCLGKMGQVARQGRTVLFVSHNMAAVSSLCTQALLLDHGRVVQAGAVDRTIQTYLRSFQSEVAGIDLSDRADRTGSGEVRFRSFRIQDDAGSHVHVLASGQPAVFGMEIEPATARPVQNLSVYLAVCTDLGAPLFLQSNLFTGDQITVGPGRTTITCRVPKLPLSAGTYRVDLGAKIGDATVDHLIGVAHFEVMAVDYYGTGHISPPQFPVLVDARWSAADAHGSKKENVRIQ